MSEPYPIRTVDSRSIRETRRFRVLRPAPVPIPARVFAPCVSCWWRPVGIEWVIPEVLTGGQSADDPHRARRTAKASSTTLMGPRGVDGAGVPGVATGRGGREPVLIGPARRHAPRLAAARRGSSWPRPCLRIVGGGFATGRGVGDASDDAAGLDAESQSSLRRRPRPDRRGLRWGRWSTMGVISTSPSRPLGPAIGHGVT